MNCIIYDLLFFFCYRCQKKLRPSHSRLRLLSLCH